MDTDAGATRDPRLARPLARPPLNRPPSVDATSSASPTRFRPGSQTVGSSSPVDAQNATADQFIRGISDLVQAAVIAANGKSEQERLKKKRDATDALLRKAKVHSSFPSTTAFFQQSKEEEDADLAQLDKSLEKHANDYRDLENALKAKFSSIMSLEPLNRVNQLQSEVQNAKKDIIRLHDYNINLEGKMSAVQDKVGSFISLQDRVNSLEKATSYHSKLARENTERVTKITADLETTFASKEQEINSAASKTQMDQLRKQTSDLTRQIEVLQKSQRECSDYLNKMNKSMDDHRRQQDTRSMENTRSLTSLTARLTSVEEKNNRLPSPAAVTAPEPSAMSEELASRLQKLEAELSGQHERRIKQMEDQLEGLQTIQQMKDDFQFKEIEDLKKVWDRGAQEFEQIRSDYARVSEELKGLSQAQAVANPAGVQAHIQGIASGLMNMQNMVETLRVALHSLETRYNNLSTDTIVKHMVVAMQEMYPSTAQLTEQINLIRAWFERDVPPLKAITERLHVHQVNLVEQTQKDMALRMEEINRLRSQQTNLSQSLAPVWERLTAQNQNRWLTADDLRQMQNDLTSLAAKIDEHTNKLDGYVKSREAKDQLLHDDLTTGRNNLHMQLHAIAERQTELEKICSKFQKTNDLPDQVRALAVKQEELMKGFSNSQNDDWRDQVKELADKQETLAKSLSVYREDGLQDQVRALADEQKKLLDKFSDSQQDKIRRQIKSLIDEQKTLAGRLVKTQEEHDQLKALVEAQEDLAKKLCEIQSSNEDDLNVLKACPDELKAVLDRVCQLETSTLEKYQTVVEEHKLLEGSMSKNLTGLTERVDGLMKLVESSQQPPQLEAPPQQEDNPDAMKDEDEANDQDSEVSRFMSMAETTPARALKERKRKRPVTSNNASDEDRSSLSRPESPNSNAAGSAAGGDAGPSNDRKSKKKKGKKRKLQKNKGPQASGNIITID
ncbi:hypothetical protein AtubIFM55763_002224 [Aspergillus tubingensis]|uniref:Paramyosin n=1 Tax=Aspergillus niger TaxID=5061 RepID=A0A100I305_ASPNG|nr:paramyosin [Aspergillus niger]GLA71744.1 hypothetical protein AtubIFM55763_002224 [Aspergillus tubingensis]